MADLDVALRLRLINGLKAGATDAKRDLAGVGAAAKNLGQARGLNTLSRDLEASAARAKRLERQLAGLRNARGFNGLGPALDTAAGGAEKVARASRRIARDLEKAKGSAVDLASVFDRIATVAGRAGRASAELRRAGGHVLRGDSAAHVARRIAVERGGGGGIDPLSAGAAAGRLGAGALGFAGGGYVATTAARRAVKTFADVETAAKALAITADQSDATVAKSVEDFRAKAAAYGSSAKEMIETAKTFVEAGLDYDTAIKAVIPTVKTAKASFGELSETAKAGVAAMNNLEIKAEDLPDAFDRMAKAGKEGNVELANLARILPAVAASGSKLGLKGLAGLTDISAALEILGKVTASPDEAANRLENLFEKITADETVKNFKKVGEAMGKTIDLEKEIAKGAKNGETALAVVLRLTRDLTKGNPFRINELFGDMQARAAIEGLLKFEGEYNGIRERIAKGSKGMIDNDLSRATNRLAADFEKLGAAWDRLMGRVGENMAPGVSAATKEMTTLLERIEQGETLIQRFLTRYGDTDVGRKAIEDKLNGNADLEKRFEDAFPALSGKKWNEWIDKHIGATKADAERLRDRDAADRQAETERRTLARPDEIREQLRREQAKRAGLVERARPFMQGPDGAQRVAASDALASSASKISKLENQLAAAEAAVEAVKAARAKEVEAVERLMQTVQSMARTSSFGLNGVNGEAGPVGSGRDAFGFGLNGTKNRAVPLPPARPDELRQNQLKAEVKAEPQDLSGVGSATMSTYEQAVKAGLEKTHATAKALVEQMKATLSFTATPTITPRISAPMGGGGGAAPAAAPARASAPVGGGSGITAAGGSVPAGGAGIGAPTMRSASLRRRGGDNNFHGPIHVHGVRDVASLERGIRREADRAVRTARNNALHDTGNDFA